MNKENKNKLIWIIIGILVLAGFIWHLHNEETTIAGRIDVIKNLKMSDIADVKR